MYRVLKAGDLVCRGKEPPAVWNPGDGPVEGSLPLFVGLSETRAPTRRSLPTVNMSEWGSEIASARDPSMKPTASHHEPSAKPQRMRHDATDEKCAL